MARKVPLAAGSIVVVDRGYNDDKLFAAWTDNGIYFVTRLKDNADDTVIDERSVPENRNIISDHMIRLNGYKAKKQCPHILRKVVVDDKDNDRQIVLVTNHMTLGPARYRRFIKTAGRLSSFSRPSNSILRSKPSSAPGKMR